MTKPREPVDYGAPLSHSPNPPAGLDLGPVLTGGVCSKCFQSFQRNREGEIVAKVSQFGAVCEECAR